MIQIIHYYPYDSIWPAGIQTKTSQTWTLNGTPGEGRSIQANHAEDGDGQGGLAYGWNEWREFEVSYTVEVTRILGI